ncbi:vWA domain-containing protein [Aquamicrobium terrae]|uniref:Ca-activated chloride channel family protein n=1 Tax=Aquamicrobium terrae TaxID=1324945 RepID=A0ABV2MTJ1_9HYPH
MVDDKELRRLGGMDVPKASPQARVQALHAAMQAFDAQEEISAAPQGMAARHRLTGRARKLWRDMMQKKLIAAPALAGLVALPIAGYTALYLVQGSHFTSARHDTPPAEAPAGEVVRERAEMKTEALENAVREDAAETEMAAPQAPSPASADMPAARPAPHLQKQMGREGTVSLQQRSIMVHPAPEPFVPAQPNRDKVGSFDSNPVRSAAEQPVSTFSVDVDTASYAYVRRSLNQGVLPQPDTVRVEEMVNYFPYAWKGPESAETPFNADVTVMPAPWNGEHRLMHVAIKGYDVQPAEKPKANLVFLVDVSGSMNEPDKLPLLQSAFRMLVNRLEADDTVSIVTYAGEAGTVLEPTKASDKAKILAAIDGLQAGGSTAGEAGIREAYRLAKQSFVGGGVNRVMLATDGDFNVGQTDDGDLKRLIEGERKAGIFLSVLGFGRGNLNDSMMQTIAQNGNGTAAYIDTLAEAEKVLVQESASTLFPIAKDVKIQVEFNPQKVSEYRLIGYETRALAREDFNNDRIDAGDIGSGHSVTAIYEITPKGAAQQIDPLRYGEASTDNGGVANADEYAFVKIRYKLPDEDTSKLITRPVTAADEVTSFAAAGEDQRFSVAVAAFGQKLREEGELAGFGYDRIQQMASESRGTDPFGYRAEFLSLVRLAEALSGRN